MGVLRKIEITILKATLRQSELKYAKDALDYIIDLENKLEAYKTEKRIKSKF